MKNRHIRYLRNLTLRNNILDIANESSETLHAQLLMYYEIHEYRTSLAEAWHLAHGHILHQKFCELKVYDPEIPQEMADSIKNILWTDANGADSQNLVDAFLFNEIETWLTPIVTEFLNQYEQLPKSRKLIGEQLSEDKKHLDVKYPDLAQQELQALGVTLVAKPSNNTQKHGPINLDPQSDESNQEKAGLRNSAFFALKHFPRKIGARRINNESPQQKQEKSKALVRAKSLPFLETRVEPQSQISTMEAKNWNNKHVLTWLKLIGFESMREQFLAKGVTGDDLLSYTKADLKQFDCNSKVREALLSHIYSLQEMHQQTLTFK